MRWRYLPYLDSTGAATGATAGLRSPYPVTGFQMIGFAVKHEGRLVLLALKVVTVLIVFLHSLQE